MPLSHGITLLISELETQTVAVLGFTFGEGGSGVAIIAAGGTDLYCHSEPPLTRGKLCFIINFIGRGHGEGGKIFTGGRGPHGRPFEPSLNLMQPWFHIQVCSIN